MIVSGVRRWILLDGIEEEVSCQKIMSKVFLCSCALGKLQSSIGGEELEG